MVGRHDIAVKESIVQTPSRDQLVTPICDYDCAAGIGVGPKAVDRKLGWPINDFVVKCGYVCVNVLPLHAAPKMQSCSIGTAYLFTFMVFF